MKAVDLRLTLSAFLNTVLLNQFSPNLRTNGCFCQMQRLIDQRAKLSGKFTAKLFLVISIITGACLAYEKERIRFAIDCKSDSFFQFEAEFSQRLFFTKI
jgi:hypothetical protein